MTGGDLPEFRWCIYFKTDDGKQDWFDQVAKHPAGAKKAAIDELERMGHTVDEFYTDTRTEAKQSRAVLRMRLVEPTGPVDSFVNVVIGAMFDSERGETS